MKVVQKLAMFTVAIVGVLSLAPRAFAGEGGAAAAAVFTLTVNADVTSSVADRVAVSAAIGKNGAVANAAYTNDVTNGVESLAATAMGSAGDITSSLALSSEEADGEVTIPLARLYSILCTVITCEFPIFAIYRQP